MNTLFESAGIALHAIWAAKLRSFMTVLGNIVAVTSIISVVALIQGLNASVQDAILNQAGITGISANFLKVLTANRRLFAVADVRKKGIRL